MKASKHLISHTKFSQERWVWQVQECTYGGADGSFRCINCCAKRLLFAIMQQNCCELGERSNGFGLGGQVLFLPERTHILTIRRANGAILGILQVAIPQSHLPFLPSVSSSAVYPFPSRLMNLVDLRIAATVLDTTPLHRFRGLQPCKVSQNLASASLRRDLLLGGEPASKGLGVRVDDEAEGDDDDDDDDEDLESMRSDRPVPGVTDPTSLLPLIACSKVSQLVFCGMPVRRLPSTVPHPTIAWRVLASFSLAIMIWKSSAD